MGDRVESLAEVSKYVGFQLQAGCRAALASGSVLQRDLSVQIVAVSNSRPPVFSRRHVTEMNRGRSILLRIQLPVIYLQLTHLVSFAAFALKQESMTRSSQQSFIAVLSSA